ncbi:MAG: M48 family metalloprotease [Thermoanaerobaculia bacterium]|nr:M48 family metalloprotease [Thermoanaerobaculia bacterium]
MDPPAAHVSDSTSGAGVRPKTPDAGSYSDRIRAAFPERIEPVQVGAAYKAGLGLVAATMVVLPILYLALLVATAFGVYQIAATGPDWIPDSRNRFEFYAWLAAILVGVVLVFFMVKPLFAPRPPRLAPRSVDPRLESFLFEFVHRICRLVGAPIPKRIDIDLQANASASFDEGWGAWSRGELVLTLGLPLVRGLTVEQLAGVVAHELGHFAQGAGMRLTYIIRAVNHWFSRLVYDRDKWDQKLDEAAAKHSGHHVALAFLLYGSKLMVWLVRKLLWCLMMLGHGISCFMMRQMEFDADRYEARLVGADVFASTCRRLGALGLAHQQAFGELDASWREGRLVDDFPALVQSVRKDLPAEAKAWLDEMARENKTGLLDTHPADRDRIASAKLETVPYPFACDLTATVLFRDFGELSRRLSKDFYELQLGRRVRPAELLDAQSVRQARRQEVADYEAIPRVTGGNCDPERALDLGVDGFGVEPDPGRVAGRLEELRRKIDDGRSAQQQLRRRFDEAMGGQMEAIVASDLVSCKVKLDPDQFAFAKGTKVTAEVVESRVEMHRRRIGQLEAEMTATEAEIAERLSLALSLLDLPAIAARDPLFTSWRQHRSALLESLAAFHRERPRLRSLGHSFCRYGNVGARLETESEKLSKHFLALAEALFGELMELRSAWSETPYPFDHAKTDASMADFCFAEPLEEIGEDYGLLHNVAGEALERAAQLHARVVGRLCSMTERLESELGFAPLEVPEGSEPQQASGSGP